MDLRATSTQRLSPYPFRWEGLEEFSYRKDEAGVPMVDMGGEVGLRYNPVTIAQYGLFQLQRHTEKDPASAREQAMPCVTWLLENFSNWRPASSIGAWVYDFDLSFYGPVAPWISAMAQGQGISLLLRFHQIEAIKHIREITENAFRAFLFPVAEGGVVRYFPDATPVFEEFTTAAPSCVLNGHIFALLGIYDYAQVWQNSQAQELFGTAVSGLRENLYRYDTGFWNLYDLHESRRLASPMYIKVHVQLLNILAVISGEDSFREMAAKWQAYLGSPFCRAKWFLAKVAEKIRLRL